jgi:peptidoglycan/LPS O-acetylase OafA/YrhL
VSASTEPDGDAPNDRPSASLAPERDPGRSSRAGRDRQERRGDIQGLRGVAVLLVIGVHAAGFPRSGFIGVDVFFVISGFVIANRLLAEAEGTGSISIPRFYARRFQRIAPAALLTLAAVVAAASLLPAARRASVVVDAVWAAFGGGNIRMILMPGEREGGFLQVSPVGHFWSLAVEEQFYLLLPLGLVLAWRLGSRRGAAHRWVLGTGVTGLCAALALAVADVALGGDAAYYSTTGRGWELGAGVVLAILAPRFRPLGPGARSVLAFGGLIALEIAAVGWLQEAYPLPAGLIPVGGAAALIIAGSGGTSVLTRALGVGWLRWVGDRSYSLYLWHFPILVFMLVAQPTGRWDVIAESTVLTVAVAALSFRFVERPASAMFRQGGRSAGRPSDPRMARKRPAVPASGSTDQAAGG